MECSIISAVELAIFSAREVNVVMEIEPVIFSVHSLLKVDKSKSEISFAASKCPKFKAGKALKERVNK